MARFRYYLDFGSGYTLVEPYNNEMVWHNYNDITPAIYRKKIEGTITFVGSTFDDIIADGRQFIPFKIQEYDGSWNDFYESSIDTIADKDYNKKSISVKLLIEDSDPYTIFVDRYDIGIDFDTLGLTTYAISVTDTSTTQDAVKVAGTGLLPAAYILAYDINGFASIPGYPDPRWAYFLFRSTDAGGHNFETMAFSFGPGENTGFTEIRMLISGNYTARWVRLPAAVGVNISVTTQLCINYNSNEDIIDKLVSDINASLGYNDTAGITFSTSLNFNNYRTGKISEVINAKSDSVNISLKWILDLYRDFFNIFWYIDTTASLVKFKNTSQLVNGTSLDLTTLTEHLQQTELIYDPMPNSEVFATYDSTGIFDILGSFNSVYIYYAPGTSGFSSVIWQPQIVNEIQINTDVRSAMSQLGNYKTNSLMMMEATDLLAITSLRANNLALSLGNLTLNTSQLGDWRYNDRMYVNPRDVITGTARPLYKLPDINISEVYTGLLNDFDVYREVTTALGTTIIKEVRYEFKTNDTILVVEL